MTIFLKKFFSLIFILIFFYGCATGTSVVTSGEVYRNMSKNDLRNVLFKVYPGDDPFISGSFSKYDSSKKKEIVAGESRKVYYVFKNVSKPIKCGLVYCNYGNGKLESWHFNYSDALASLTEKKQQIKKQPKLVTKSIDSSDNSYVEKLDKLIEDFENGKITEEEFNSKKAEILK